MTLTEYARLAIDCKDKHSCLLFADESIPTNLVGLFIPSRAFTLAQLRIYLTGFGLSDADIVVVPLTQRPKKAPLGGYVVTIPLPKT